MDGTKTSTGGSEVRELLRVRSDRWSKVLLVVAALAFGFGAILFGLGYYQAHSRSDVWDPLGDYPSPQTIVNANGTIPLSRTVDVRGTKCFDQPVVTRGGKYWQAVDVRGTTIPDGQSVRLHPKGCETPTFHNEIPAEVQQIVAGGGPNRWTLQGTDTPIDPVTGRQGVPRTWQTEPFTLTP